MGAGSRSFICKAVPKNYKITCTDSLMTPDFEGPVGTIY